VICNFPAEAKAKEKMKS